MTSVPAKQKYVDTLDNITKERYLAKISLIGDIDPYEVGNNLDNTHDGLPDITYPDIVNYLVFTQSAYTLDQLKAYKSLEAYNYVVSDGGWVKDLQHLVINDRVLITAKVCL